MVESGRATARRSSCAASTPLAALVELGENRGFGAAGTRATSVAGKYVALVIDDATRLGASVSTAE